MEGRLLLHTLGKPPDLPLFGQPEGIIQPVKQAIVKAGVHPPVKPAHILHGGGGEVKHIVRDVADDLFHFGIFPDGLTVQGYRTGIRAVNARQVTDGGGFACTVGAHQAVHAALGNGHGQIVQSSNGAEALGDIFHFKHGSSLLF